MLLKGVRVLDLSVLLPGPMCSLFLADLGAEVIKIESPSGDGMRQIERIDEKSPYFEALNRSKKSIAVNLKTQEGKKILKDLARKSDVIIEGFRPGKARTLGADYKTLKRVNKRIIYCSITGYGQKVSYKNRAGHDLNFNAMAGILDILGNNYFVPGLQIADCTSAIVAAFSIVSALYSRKSTKKGVFIDVSMVKSAMSLLNIHIARESMNAKTKSILSGAAPCYNIYKTKDGKCITLGAIEKKFWGNFCRVIGRNDLVAQQYNAKKVAELKKIFKAKTMEEWKKLNNKYDLCCEPVIRVKDLADNPEIKESRALISINGISQIAMPSSFSSIKLRYKEAPVLGQHSDETLLGIGYPKELIQSLRSSKIIL